MIIGIGYIFQATERKCCSNYRSITQDTIDVFTILLFFRSFQDSTTEINTNRKEKICRKIFLFIVFENDVSRAKSWPIFISWNRKGSFDSWIRAWNCPVAMISALCDPAIDYDFNCNSGNNSIPCKILNRGHPKRIPCNIIENIYGKGRGVEGALFRVVTRFPILLALNTNANTVIDATRVKGAWCTCIGVRCQDRIFRW